MAPEFPVSQGLSEGDLPKEMKNSKVAGWSTKKMDEKTCEQVFERFRSSGAMEEHRSARN